MVTELSPDAFIDAEESSFSYYSALPSDDVRLSPDWPRLALDEVAGRLARTLREGQATEADIDALGLALLAQRLGPLPAEIDWHDLATRLSVLYGRLMSFGSPRRLRMKAQRTNFFLRDMLDRAEQDLSLLIEQKQVSGSYPWDWWPDAEGDLIVDCAEKNVRYVRTSGESRSCRAGLPTQIDRFADKIAIGSCYSKGWFTFDPVEETWKFHDHDAPVLLAVERDGQIICLDANGTLFSPGRGGALLSVSVEAAGRARCIDDVIYLSDWARPRELIRIELDGLRTSAVSTGPVILANDICKLGQRFYMVDKMQGRVFSFDEHFNPVDARMSFGKGRGRLFDPITLRVHNGNLCVLSWLTGALATIRPF